MWDEEQTWVTVTPQSKLISRVSFLPIVSFKAKSDCMHSTAFGFNKSLGLLPAQEIARNMIMKNRSCVSFRDYVIASTSASSMSTVHDRSSAIRFGVIKSCCMLAPLHQGSCHFYPFYQYRKDTHKMYCARVNSIDMDKLTYLDGQCTSGLQEPIKWNISPWLNQNNLDENTAARTHGHTVCS